MPSHFSELKLQDETESCVAAHLFAEESLTMITKTETNWLTSLQVKRRAR